MERPRLSSWAWFLFVMVLAVCLRAWHLTGWDLWTDEMHTARIAASGEFFGPTYAAMPLNFLLTGIGIRLFGMTELGIRIVPFLAGCFTIVLTYVLGRRWIGHRAALLASLFLALLAWHIAWSQTGRHFGLQTLFLTIGLHGFLVAWKEGRVWGHLLAIAGFFAAIFTFASTGFFVAGLGVFVVASGVVSLRGIDGPERRKQITRHILALTPLLLVLLVYTPFYFSVGSDLLAHTRRWNPVWNVVGSIAFYLPPWLTVSAMAGIVFLWYEGDDLWGALAGFTLVPIALLAVASMFTIAGSSYILGIALPTVWLAGVAGDRLLQHVERQRRIAVAVVVAAIALGLSGDTALYHSAYNGYRARWRSVAAYLVQHRSPGEIVVSSEGDVLRHYLSDPSVYWLDYFDAQLEQVQDTIAAAPGVWYAVYVDEGSLQPVSGGTRQRIRERSQLKALFPANYGPKDRTILLFWEDSETRRQLRDAPAQMAP